ncbi:MAG TPA: tetraacyldisaccharide 4'-kinase [Burkholderiaceae bacterium]|nr:tetraacyldisaccharide 4'-kinase [Burkholderiaceae bacterium]
MAGGRGRRAAPRPAGSWRAALERRLQRLWFAPRGAADRAAGWLLRPLAIAVGAVAAERRRRIAHGKLRRRAPGEPPVVVVGNLAVGGTGKTPLLIALAQALARRGWRPGVVARGHGARARASAPVRVGPGSDARECGDEPVLVARRTGLPVAVSPDRAAALRALLEAERCDVVLSDDGLQHEGLARDLELAVFDARGAGNGRCLPAGPLREPLRGALLLDALVLNGADAVAPIVHSRVFRFRIEPTAFVELADGRVRGLEETLRELGRGPVHAVAGIGAPQRFFDTLARLGLEVRGHALADHAPIDPAWLAALPGGRVVVTEKDAVKCTGFDDALRARCVALRVEAVPEAALVDWLEDRLRG